jgi:hypothetical protein
MTADTLSHKNAQEQALNGMEHKRFVTTTGERFHFMWDNAHDDERIKSYYLGTRRLYDAYDNAPLVVEKKEWYTTLSDTDRMHRESPSLTKPKRWQEIIRQARKVYEALGCNATEDEVIAYLGEQYRDMTHAIYIIGAREIVNLKYNERAIAEAIKQREHFNEVREKAASDVYALMQEGEVETTKNINDTMKMILDSHGITPIGRVDRRYIEMFFVVENIKRNGDRCFLLKRSKRV